MSRRRDPNDAAQYGFRLTFICTDAGTPPERRHGRRRLVDIIVNPVVDGAIFVGIVTKPSAQLRGRDGSLRVQPQRVPTDGYGAVMDLGKCACGTHVQLRRTTLDALTERLQENGRHAVKDISETGDGALPL